MSLAQKRRKRARLAEREAIAQRLAHGVTPAAQFQDSLARGFPHLKAGEVEKVAVMLEDLSRSIAGTPKRYAIEP